MLTPNVNLNGKTILVTGAAGFIGSNLVMELLRTAENVTIVGLDNMNDYYEVSLKEYRLRQLEGHKNFIFIKGDLADKECIMDIFSKCNTGLMPQVEDLKANNIYPYFCTHHIVFCRCTLYICNNRIGNIHSNS